MRTKTVAFLATNSVWIILNIVPNSLPHMIKNKKYNHSEILENYSFEIQLNLVLANMKEAVHEPRKAELRVISTDDNQYLKKTRQERQREREELNIL